MGNFVIKPNEADDCYVVWNSVSNGPEFIGCRDEAKHYLLMFSDLRGERAVEAAEERLRRTDLHGTSALWPEEGGYIYGWGDGVLIYDQCGILRREKLREFTEVLHRGDRDAALDLLEPFDDETEVRRG